MKTENEYKGLPTLLHRVRWTQHFFAIVAELLILLSFAMSAWDNSISGAMAHIPWMAWLWGGMFALGVDTCFVISWVRVRKCVNLRRWGAFVWNLFLALGMSGIVFPPVVIQMLQQSLNISFTQALSMLDMNIVVLVYARGAVATVLGAVLALTNVEGEMSSEVSSVQRPRRRIVLLDRALDKIAPVDTSTNGQVTVQVLDTVAAQPVQLPAPKRPAQPRPVELLPVPTAYERVQTAIREHPDASDRQIALMSNVSPTTVGKYRKQVSSGQDEAM